MSAFNALTRTFSCPLEEEDRLTASDNDANLNTPDKTVNTNITALGAPVKKLCRRNTVPAYYKEDDEDDVDVLIPTNLENILPQEPSAVETLEQLKKEFEGIRAYINEIISSGELIPGGEETPRHRPSDIIHELMMKVNKFNEAIKLETSINSQCSELCQEMCAFYEKVSEIEEQ
jgi:hypothetical protein